MNIVDEIIIIALVAFPLYGWYRGVFGILKPIASLFIWRQIYAMVYSFGSTSEIGAKIQSGIAEEITSKTTIVPNEIIDNTINNIWLQAILPILAYIAVRVIISFVFKFIKPRGRIGRKADKIIGLSLGIAVPCYALWAVYNIVVANGYVYAMQCIQESQIIQFITGLF